MRFDELGLVIVKPILLVQLLVNFRNGFRPINVGLVGEILKRNHPPNFSVIILRNFQNTKQNSEELSFYIFKRILSLLLFSERTQTNEGLCVSFTGTSYDGVLNVSPNDPVPLTRTTRTFQVLRFS